MLQQLQHTTSSSPQQQQQQQLPGQYSSDTSSSDSNASVRSVALQWQCSSMHLQRCSSGSCNTLTTPAVMLGSA
jgi:hypothetical protein